ncbi:MAG: flagellar hook-basal body complex protein [Ruminococcaceae bacterium]|nr:flagellar hook-basal body complex protein [Oscillospiraceae bacterium]
MMKSLYSGVAGLKVHNQRMDVIGNNISNVNTTGYKASAVTFKDIFYQNKSYATSGDIMKGGTNANQVGYGASLGSIGQVMTQSGLTYSDSVTDCAIQGEGFFQVMDQVGNIYYTRNGNFHIDNVGNLCDANGNIVLGVSGDPTGVAASSNRINLYVPPIDNRRASVEKVYKDGLDEYTYTITANSYGDNGNISFTIIDIDDDETPFATQNDRTITVRIDLDQDFLSPTETPAANETRKTLEQAINDALTVGGVELPGEVLPLNFEYTNMPADTHAVAATNTLNFAGTDEANPLNPPLSLTFTAAEAGAFANNYEINIVAYTPQGNDTNTNGGVKANWTENVLTIRVPNTRASSAADINAAIAAAAGENNRRVLTVATTDTISAVQAGAIGDTNLRLGLQGGKDNFFKSIAETMDTVKLVGGSVAADQTTKDLESIFIDDDGVIYGVHTVHGTIAMGRIDLVVFENPEGLDQVGTSYWKESLSSGAAITKKANDVGTGSIVSTALEMSNADLSQEISDMIITQRGFQANSRVITVTDTMLEELVNLKR